MLLFNSRLLIANFSWSIISKDGIYRRSLFSAPIKKFYKNVSISQTCIEAEDYPVFEILLDHRKLRTPGGNQFYVPNQPLALAVAHEWDSQKDTIKKYAMHLTTLCNRVLDNKLTDNEEVLVDGIMQYVDTDTICFRCKEPDDLVTLQSAAWDPILRWINERYQIHSTITNKVTALPEISVQDRDLLTRHFKSYNRWGLTGIKACTEYLKSVFLSLAVLDGFCSVARAVELSQLELLFQAHRYGEVESYHDIEIAELNARVSAGMILAMLSHNRYEIKTKLGRSGLEDLAGVTCTRP